MITSLLNRFGSLCIAAAVSLPAMAQIPPDVELVEVFPSGTFSGPLGYVPANDGSGRMFVIQQNGIIRVVAGDGTLLGTPFLDLEDLTTSGGERGLLGLAFHPDHETNGLFYLNYSAGPNRPAGTDSGDTIVAEFSITGDPNIANDTPNRIILTVNQDFSNHNGGNIAFGPDGYLYIGMGDGGSGGDPCNRAQTLDPANLVPPSSCGSSGPTDDNLALLGKMLRIDVDNTTPAGSNNLCAAESDGSAEYAIPADNPYVGQANRCGEVYIYGLRNPWRWSFDHDTGDLWIGDVGQGQWEEVDLLEAPLTGDYNMGWRCFEGSSTFTTAGDCPTPGHIPPVMEYSHSGTGGCSITGGYRYRGPVASLQDYYIFSDVCAGDIWFGSEGTPGNWSFEEFDTTSGPRSFGEDEQGRVYAVLSNGGIQEISGEVELIFVDGFESE